MKREGREDEAWWWGGAQSRFDKVVERDPEDDRDYTDFNEIYY